jgi:hypothetical protein
MRKYNSLHLISWIFLLGMSLFILSCADNKNSEKKIESNATDDSNEKFEFQDSLKLSPGTIPEGWTLVMLDESNYIGFPKKPWKKISKGKKRVEFHYPKKSYDCFVSLSSLENEQAYEINKEQIHKFYETVLNDLLEDFKDSDQEKKSPQVVEKKPFLFLNLYTAAQYKLQASDFQLYVQLVVMGNKLYTLSFVLWGNEKKEITQIKDRFFNSFGKKVNLKENEDIKHTTN